MTRHHVSSDKITAIYQMPLMELVSKAHLIHLKHHEISEVQLCTLVSIKTGGCPEDCKYCAQSSRYQTSVDAKPLMQLENVLKLAQEAKKNGSTRVCLGAAWREVRDSKQFDEVIEMVKSITEMGLEVCCTLGLLKEHQAKRLEEAGLFAYNHNLDSSESFYNTIITTRSYQDRLNTLDIIDKTKISVCCGGIIGMGETDEDRLELLRVLSNRNPHPESVPINFLVPIPGTPLGHLPKLSFWKMLRMIATTRILMPFSMVRLSAGRENLSLEQHALAFFAGANSIFSGEKLLTVSNTPIDVDEEMFATLGLSKRAPFIKPQSKAMCYESCY